MAKNEKYAPKILGTNCFNCLWIGKKDEQVNSNALNLEGGIDPHDEKEMERARTADLITLPGGSKQDAPFKRLCYNEKIRMYVTVRMCCGYWDNENVKRPWKTKK